MNLFDVSAGEARISDARSVLNELYPSWDPQTIWERFVSCAQRYAAHEFIVMEDGRRYTYGESLSMANRIANGLWAIGVRPGDHVALRLSSGPKAIFIALALARLMAVRVSINPMLGSYELKFVLDRSRARYVITDDAMKLHENDSAATLKGIVRIAEAEVVSTCPVIEWSTVVALGAAQRADAVVPDPNAPAEIMYTSGSTGHPKGALLTHDSLLRSAYANCMNRGFEQGRRILVTVPFNHCFAYVEGMLSALFVGACLVILQGKFDEEALVEVLKREKVNDVLCVPYMMLRTTEYLRDNPDQFPFLHAMYCAGEQCSGDLWSDIRETMGLRDIVDGYGMTEISGAAMQTRPFDGVETLQRRVGRIMDPGAAGLEEYNGKLIEYRVVDPETGEEVPQGGFGELWCRGATVMKEYFGDPSATTAAFSSDGWFKTGDLGRFDPAGYLELAGRLCDTYRINGENISPQFLEHIVESNVNVEQAVVVGVPDERHGAVGALFVQLSDDAPGQRDSLVRYCRESMARYQVPRYFFYMGQADWPRTASGKIRRKELQERARVFLADGLP